MSDVNVERLFERALACEELPSPLCYMPIHLRMLALLIRDEVSPHD